ncbi:putative internal virion protein [Alteromonas phage vB_AspP-H4/4]|uniref:Internal virion protein n=1 Tax=Alteromonas phage vB_AspP-H4/4 TaxID=2928692 RepID=A0A220YL89_9CAUD|nr:putative internal virion protein [Alteromonas phage vB_AspP-H4/4]ASL24421.1 putative internal virion protein [Alteromonas phage vB_AspP-H4/4]
MSQFGQPQRSATQDANAGVVNPPAEKRQARQFSTKEIFREGTPGLDAFAESLGSALQQRLTEESNNINEKRANAAAVRQGKGHAINTVDQAKKHTGWERAVFGENVEYRAAQQRAAQNAVQSEYIKQASELDKYAGETPEDYEARLQSGLDKVLEPYGDDQETKTMVANAYHTMSAKLAAKQYESHYAYNQTQQRQTYLDQTLATFDQWNVDKGLISSQQEAGGFMLGIKSFFDGKTKPKGMDDIAWRGVVNEGLSVSLRNGNIGAYTAAKANGWLKTLNEKETTALNQAVSAYDTKFSQQVQLTYENAEIAALEANDLEVASGIYHNLLDELDQLSGRSSGTERAELALAKTKSSALSSEQSAKKAAEKIAKDAFEAAQKAQAAQKRIDDIAAALRMDDPVERSGALSTLQPKPKELEDIMDMTIIEDVGRLTGVEDISASEAVKHIMTKPEVAKSIASRIKGRQTDVPLVKRTAETFINGFHGMINEDGQLNDDGLLAMQSLSQFAQNSDTFKNIIGSENFDKYEMIRRGMSVGQTIEMMNKDIDAYTKNKGSRDIYATQWNLGSGVSKRDRVSQLYKQFTDSTPNSAALGYAMEEINRGLVVYKGDMKLAEQYLKTSLQNASLTYRGKNIINGKSLDKVTDYNFEQLMDGVSAPVGNSSLLTPILQMGGMKVSDDKPYIPLEDDVSFYVVDGTDGFFVDHPQFQQPIRVPSNTMRMWSDVLTQRNNFNQMEEEAKGDSFEGWLEEQENLRGRPAYPY